MRYLWHPWYGEQVCVQGEARRGAGLVLRCTRDEHQRFPPLEIPAWMFDSAVCGRLNLGTCAYVSSAALLALQELLLNAADSIEPVLIQAQHISSSSGGADADRVTIQVQSRRAVLFTRAATGVAAGSSSGDDRTPGPDDARTSAEGHSLERTRGGGR
jgi:hypothetical protein